MKEPAFPYNFAVSIEMNILRLRRRITAIERKPTFQAWRRRAKRMYGLKPQPLRRAVA